MKGLPSSVSLGRGTLINRISGEAIHKDCPIRSNDRMLDRPRAQAAAARHIVNACYTNEAAERMACIIRLLDTVKFDLVGSDGEPVCPGWRVVRYHRGRPWLSGVITEFQWVVVTRENERRFTLLSGVGEFRETTDERWLEMLPAKECFEQAVEADRKVIPCRYKAHLEILEEALDETVNFPDAPEVEL